MLAAMCERPALRSVADQEDYNHLPAQPPGRTEPLSRPGVAVWVQCGASITAAYRDPAGIWRSYARGQQLKPPVKTLAVILRASRRPGGPLPERGLPWQPAGSFFGVASPLAA